MFDRLHTWGAAALILIGVSACGLNAPGVNPTVIVTAIPTNTLAPIVTTTDRFTATPLPSATFIPTPTVNPTDTVPPPTLTNTPPPTPTQSARGVVRTDSGIVNMRLGPGSTYKVLGNLKSGSTLLVMYTSTDQKWTLVQLDDGSEGWVSSALVTLSDPSVTLPALTTPELTQRAIQGTANSLTQTALAPTPNGGGGLVAANAPTHPARIDTSTDVLAYCDQRNDASRNKKFALGAKITVFWSWVAKTPEQIKDQLNYGQYQVKVDGQVIGDWQRYASAVTTTQTSDGQQYIVYWFVPLAAQPSGSHTITYQLTWKQTVFDGVNHYGPGTTQVVNTGTCTFSVK